MSNPETQPEANEAKCCWLLWYVMLTCAGRGTCPALPCPVHTTPLHITLHTCQHHSTSHTCQHHTTAQQCAITSWALRAR